MGEKRDWCKLLASNLMRRIVFIVEGDTEIQFVEKQIIPYLLEKCGYHIPMNAQKITTNKKKNCKGGNVGIEYLRNEIRKIAASGDTFITTLLDFFRLPNDFPNYTTDKTRVTEIEQGLTDAMTDIVSHNRFLPYIQLHEVEALMFIKVEGFELLIEEDRQRQELQNIIAQYPNPEDINGGRATAPSKRLEKIFPKYKKVSDSECVFGEISIDEIRNKCHRFNSWLENIQNRLQNIDP